MKVINPMFTFIKGDLLKEEIKRCPKCQALIVKMDDGSCNHITCSVCGCEFCWLCMKEISDLHYLSPSGCTFWGKKPWSRKKKNPLAIGHINRRTRRYCVNRGRCRASNTNWFAHMVRSKGVCSI